MHKRCPRAVERFHAPINTVAHMGVQRERDGGGGQAEVNGTKKLANVTQNRDSVRN